MITTHVPLARWSAPAVPTSVPQPAASDPLEERIAGVNAELDMLNGRIVTTRRLQTIGQRMVQAGPIALLGLVASLWVPGIGTACTAAAGAIIITGGTFSLVQVARRKRMEKQVERLNSDLTVMHMAARQAPQPGTIEVGDGETLIGNVRVPRKRA